MNASLQAFYNVENPRNVGPDWTLRFTVSVPDRDEARRIFSVDLAKKHIQPV